MPKFDNTNHNRYIDTSSIHSQIIIATVIRIIKRHQKHTTSLQMSALLLMNPAFAKTNVDVQDHWSCARQFKRMKSLPDLRLGNTQIRSLDKVGGVPVNTKLQALAKLLAILLGDEGNLAVLESPRRCSMEDPQNH